MGLLGSRARPDDVVIGSVFAWVLGLGVLFLSIFASGSSGADGTAAVRVLFGSILGLSAGDARLAAAIAIAGRASRCSRSPGRCCSARSTPTSRRSLGVPVRALGVGFLVLLAVVAAEATQAVGALLLLGLLAAPGGAARLLTDDPWRGLALSAALAVGSMWGGPRAQLRDPVAAGELAVIALATAALRAGGAAIVVAPAAPAATRGRSGRPLGSRHEPRRPDFLGRARARPPFRPPATVAAARGRRWSRRSLATTAPSPPWSWRTSCAAAGRPPAAPASTARWSSSSSSGSCSRLEVSRGVAGYERVEPGGEHHHHAICRECGRMIPFEDASLERAIDKVSGRIALTPPSTR